MDIDHLRSFVAFVDTGSFTQAAQLSCRSQGAISMQMKRLEEEAGTALFEKSGRHVVLTEQGRALASYARRIIGLHDQALGEMRRQQRYPVLRIGCPDDYVATVVPRLVSIIQRLVPGQMCHLVCESSTQLRQKLHAKAVDLVVLTRAPERDEGVSLQQDRGVWVHGGYPELLARPRLPLALYDTDCKFHSTAIDGLEKQGRAYQLLFQSSSATAIKSVVVQGMAISALAQSTVGDRLIVLEGMDLPLLPVVDIVLDYAPDTHALVDQSWVLELCMAYRRQQAL